MSPEDLDAWLRQVDTWPELTPEQRHLLERALTPTADTRAA